MRRLCRWFNLLWVAIYLGLVLSALLAGCSSIVGTHPFSSLPKSDLGKPEPPSYRTWTSAPWVQVSTRNEQWCDFVAFGVSTARRPVRLRVDDVEQALDRSWAVDVRARLNTRRVVKFEYIDPAGGALLACHEVQVACVPELDPVVRFVARIGKPCAPPATAKAIKAQQGAPRLVVSVPSFTAVDFSVGGGYVTVRAEIQGVITEQWLCPQIEVLWPDGTTTMRKSDCDPWNGQRQVQSWSFGRWFAPGESTVRVRLVRGGHVIASQTVLVRVVGAGE